jgi:hypothetical protein
MNQREAASRNANGVLVRANKAYERIYLEEREPLPRAMGTYPSVIPSKTAANEPPRLIRSKGYRIDRINQVAAVASNAPRARGSHGSGNISSQFGELGSYVVG